MDVKYGGCDYQTNNAAFVEGEEFYFNRRILCRELSGRRSSSVYYRRGEGVPFKWEKKPGTPNAKLDDDDPNNNNNNNNIIIIPPLSPPPSLQSLGLPLPCFDHHADAQQQSRHYVFSWRKIKKMLHAKIGKKKSGGSGLHQVDDHKNIGVRDSDTEFIASLKNSNSSSSSSSSSFSNGSSFCYGSPWNMKAIMDEAGNKSRYYSKEHQHKAAYFREEDGYGFSLSTILSRLSSVDESSRFYYCITTPQGIPFQWEMQPGAPKTSPQNDVIPPPTPPPLAQSLALPKPRITTRQSETANYSPWTKIWVGIKHKKMMKGNKRLMAGSRKDKEMSFRLHRSNEEVSVPLTSASSSSSPKTKMLLKLRKRLLGECSCIGPWRTKASIHNFLA